jgi:hypothetical protein
MAASPLEQINIVDFDANEYVTSQRIIYSAITERMNIGFVRGDGTFATGLSGVGNYRFYFPFGSNTGWYGNAGEPFIPFSVSENETMINRGVRNYISKQSILDDVGTNVSQLQKFTWVVGSAHSVWTYLGVTDEVPEFTIPCQEFLEIMYRFITECLTYVATSNINDLTRNLDIRIQGIFDDVSGTVSTKNKYTYAQGDSAIESDILDPVAFGVDELYSTSSYTNFPLTNSAENRMCYINILPKVPNAGLYDDFQVEAKFMQMTRIFDYSDIKSAIGIDGLPLSTKYYVNYSNGHNQIDGVTYDELLEETISHDVTGDIVENLLGIPSATANDKLTSNPMIPALPATIGDFASYDFTPTVYLQKNTSGIVSLFSNANVFHDWDGEGGFEYYTP